MTKVIYKPCGHIYEVGSDGTVWSLNYWNTGKRRKISQRIQPINFAKGHGYPYVSMYDPIKKRFISKKVHRLVAEAFLVQPTPKHQVNHKNGIRHDNRVENLEWVTAQENALDSWARGRVTSQRQRQLTSRRTRGTGNPNAKLDEKKVKEIRYLRGLGLSRSEVASNFGISEITVSSVTSRRTWGWVK